MYLVRIKEYEKKNYKVIAKFETKNEAMKYAIKLDMKWRKNFETEFNKIDIKFPDGSRFIIA